MKRAPMPGPAHASSSSRVIIFLLIALLAYWGPQFQGSLLAQDSPIIDDGDASSERPLTQPEDPTGTDPQPADGLPTVAPTDNTEGTEEAVEEKQEEDDGVIRFDPNKAVVRPAKVKQTPPPIRPRAVPPPPRHSANPEADLFEHANLVAKYELWPQAERQYKIYVENYPNRKNTQAAYYGLAEARYKLGKFAEAEATYRALLIKFQRGEHVGAAAYRLANIHYHRGEFKEAVSYFETASRTSTKPLVRQSASFFRARCLQQLGSVRRSEELYRKLASDREDHPYRAASAIILARLDVDRGQHRKAYEAFVSLSVPPTAPNIRAEAVTKAGLMAAKLDLPEEAQNYFQQILSVESADARPWHPKAFWGLLHLYYEQGRYQDLIDQYQSRRISYNGTSTASQGRVPVLLMVAHAFRRLEKYRQAASLYDQVARLDPTGPEAEEAGYRHLYCLYKDRSPFLSAKTEDYLNRHRLQGSTDQYYHLALLLKAEALFGRRQKTARTYLEAARAYGKIDLSRIPEKYHPMVTYKLGWALCEGGNHAKGIQAFYDFLNQYSDQHPELVAKVLAKRGEAFRVVKNYDSAAKDFDKLIELGGDDQLLYLALQQKGLIEVERGNHEATITAFQSLLDRFPEGLGTSEAHFFVGNAHYKLGTFEEALQPLDTARRLDPKSYTIPATQRMIVSHWRLSHLEEAAQEVDVLLREDPKTNLIPPKLWLWLGTRFFQQNKFEQSARYLKQVATPNAPKDTWPLAWSFLGQAYLNSGKYKESIPPFDHYLASDPSPDERARVMLYKATALSKVGRLEEAQAAAEEVQHLQKQGRTYGQAWILLGDIAMAQKDFEKASKYYVIPSRMFKDHLVTPIALEKAAEAYDKMGENQRGADLRRQLRDEWPTYQTASTADPS